MEDRRWRVGRALLPDIDRRPKPTLRRTESPTHHPPSSIFHPPLLRVSVPWFCLCLLLALAATGCVHEVRQRPAEKERLPQPKERFVRAPGGAFWQVAFADPGLTFLATETQEAGEVRVFRGGNEHMGISMTVYIQPAEEPKVKNTRVRDFFWRPAEARDQVTDTKLWETSRGALVAYTVPNVMESGQSRRTIALYIAYEGTWIEVQVSKLDYTKADETRLEEIINSVRVEETDRLK